MQLMIQWCMYVYIYFVNYVRMEMQLPVVWDLGLEHQCDLGDWVGEC